VNTDKKNWPRNPTARGQFLKRKGKWRKIKRKSDRRRQPGTPVIAQSQIAASGAQLRTFAKSQCRVDSFMVFFRDQEGAYSRSRWPRRREDQFSRFNWISDSRFEWRVFPNIAQIPPSALVVPFYNSISSSISFAFKDQAVTRGQYNFFERLWRAPTDKLELEWRAFAAKKM